MADGGARHGGDLARAEAEFGVPERGWLDLSTGVNPTPYPVSDVALDSYARLPDARAEDALRAAAAAYYGAAGPDRVVIVPGAQMGIQLLPRLRAHGRVSIIGPTYSEHARAWKAAGHTVTIVSNATGIEYSDVAVVTNPNNPDGKVFAADFLARRAMDLASHGGWLVVDESFADTQPEISLAPRRELSGCIVFRSFGKFFGLPGLRLGFVLAPPHVAARIRSALGPWPVNGPAIEIGLRALTDAAWVADTRAELAARSAALDAVLAGAGLAVIGGTALYRLVADPRAGDLFRFLGQAGILTRCFSDQPEWLRVGPPGGAEALDRLATALSAWRVQ